MRPSAVRSTGGTDDIDCLAGPAAIVEEMDRQQRRKFLNGSGKY